MGIMLKPSWTEEYSYDESIKILKDLAWRHVKESGEFEADLADMLGRNDFAALCAYELDYTRSDNALHHLNARQALAFFQKLEPLELGVDKERVAFGKFVAAEELCKETNQLLTALRRGDACVPPRVAAVMHGAQRKIAKMLGRVPRMSELKFSFGPGANTSVKASRASPRNKLGAALACSSELAGHVSALLYEVPEWVAAICDDFDLEDDFSLKAWFVTVAIHNGRLQFVPKNAKTYRAIVVEPILNSFVQKGIGKWLRRLMLKVGVNLRDQTRNQLLAKLGSISGHLATVDLTSASDTVSKEVVAEFFPLDWYTFLAGFRTGTVEYRDKHGRVTHVFKLEKFSSMGNAFTFELESMLFYGLTWAVCDYLGLRTDEISVYGDDIICPVEAVPLLLEVLRTLGFLPNYEKSFWSGPFRESCGKDFFLGIDIRPYYQKHLVSGRTLFTLHNYYMRHFDVEHAENVRKWIHPSLAIFGPDGYGDGHLIGGWHGRRNKQLARRGWEGAYFDTFTLRTRRFYGPSPGDNVLPAYSIYMYADPQTDTPAKGPEVEPAKYVGKEGPSIGLVTPVYWDDDSLAYQVNWDDAPLEDPYAHSRHYVVRGNSGYRRMSIYTLATGVFLR